MRIARTVVVGLMGAALVLTGCARSATDTHQSPSVTASSVAPTPSADQGLTAQQFAAMVKPDAVVDHLREFERISSEHERFRSYDSPGYEAVAVYVEAELKAAGYETAREPISIINERSRTSSLVVAGEQLEHHFFSGSPALPAEGVSAQVVVAADRVGCSATSWAEPLGGRIALTYRDPACTFAQRAAAAKAAGASAVVVVNQADEIPYGTLGGNGALPAVGVPSGVGEKLVAAMNAGTPVELRFQIDATQIDTFTVVAETKAGSDDEVLVVGAHLDGAPSGPGINDNGSGAATVLEVATQYAETDAFDDPDATRVLFAWWGAEEIGMRGSAAWVDSRTETQLGAIKGYLNFDMLGSSNYIVGVYDGASPIFPTDEIPPEGSAAITKQFTDWFDATGQAWVSERFDGRSDYQPFLLAGIPVGGIATGADGVKTQEEQDVFGGTTGQPHDANYHKVTDTVANLNQEALAITVPAVAGVTWLMSNA